MEAASSADRPQTAASTWITYAALHARGGATPKPLPWRRLGHDEGHGRAREQATGQRAAANSEYVRIRHRSTSAPTAR